MNYIMPTVVEFGKSEELIKGECGWGVEDWGLNKTGSTSKTIRVEVTTCSPVNGICYVRCQPGLGCDGDTDEC